MNIKMDMRLILAGDGGRIRAAQRCLLPNPQNCDYETFLAKEIYRCD